MRIVTFAQVKEVAGGWNGIMNIPAPGIFGYAFDERGIALFAVAFTTVSLVLFTRLKASPWGLAMRAVRDSGIAGQSLGLDLVRIRTTAFALSAVPAGLAGAVFASMANFISPESSFEGLPPGLSLVGPRDSDVALLDLAQRVAAPA